MCLVHGRCLINKSFESPHYQTGKNIIKNKYPWEGQHTDLNSRGIPVKGRPELGGQRKASQGLHKLHSLSNFASGQLCLCLCVQWSSRQLNCITLFILIIWTEFRCGIWWGLFYWTTSGLPGTLQQITVNLRAAVPLPKCQYFCEKFWSFTVYVSKMNFYFIGLIFRVIRNVCLFPGWLQMQDSYNKTRTGRFPEGGERKAFPAWLELLCV